MYSLVMAKYLRPFPGMVLIEAVRETESNGIVVPETAHKDLQSIFKVVAVGKGKIKTLKGGGLLRINPEVAPGYKVVCNTWAGKEVVVDDHKMRLVNFDSIMAVIDD